MNTEFILLILATLILGIVLFLLFSGEFRKKKLECNPPCSYPTTPGEINKQVFNSLDPKGGYQPLHINMSNNEHYVILAKPKTKGLLIIGLHFLLYNAKNTFFTIKDIEEPNKKGNTLNISILVKRCSYFDTQVQSPVFVSLTAENQLKKGDSIDIDLPPRSSNESSKIRAFAFASEVGGHICTSRVMK